MYEDEDDSALALEAARGEERRFRELPAWVRLSAEGDPDAWRRLQKEVGARCGWDAASGTCSPRAAGGERAAWEAPCVAKLRGYGRPPVCAPAYQHLRRRLQKQLPNAPEDVEELLRLHAAEVEETVARGLRVYGRTASWAPAAAAAREFRRRLTTRGLHCAQAKAGCQLRHGGTGAPGCALVVGPGGVGCATLPKAAAAELTTAVQLAHSLESPDPGLEEDDEPRYHLAQAGVQAALQEALQAAAGDELGQAAVRRLQCGFDAAAPADQACTAGAAAGPAPNPCMALVEAQGKPGEGKLRCALDPLVRELARGQAAGPAAARALGWRRARLHGAPLPASPGCRVQPDGDCALEAEGAVDERCHLVLGRRPACLRDVAGVAAELAAAHAAAERA